MKNFIKIKTKDIVLIRKLFKEFVLPSTKSHKGENGKILIIGGSSLFHAASLWAAEVCSFFSDIVHYSSTKENQKIFLQLKKIFRNGIVVKRKYLDDYIKEDDVILVGLGMMRDEKKSPIENQKDLFRIKNEGKFTRELVFYLTNNYPEKKFVFDAGALQMMDKEWFLKLKKKPIITPHQREFFQLFGIDLTNKNLEEKQKIVFQTAKKYKIIILLKAVIDIISDGERVFIVEGGNQGLTKGGTGDILSSLAASFFVKNSSLFSALFASILLKKTADELFSSYGYWYNVDTIINNLPKVLKKIIYEN